MIAQIRFAIVLAGVAVAAACTTSQSLSSAAAVGPNPHIQAQATPQGFLTVYSLRQTYPEDDETWYRVHTDYGVYDPSGRRVLSVRNAATYHDLTPKLVKLPAGRYTVRAWEEGNVLLTVPVVIRAGLTTTVNLEPRSNALFRGARTSDLVQAPDGLIIGWLADAQ